MMAAMRSASLLALAGLLAACAGTPTMHQPPAVAACVQAFKDDDARLADAGIHDAQAAPVAGHPWLRVDRLLASFSGELSKHAQRAAWLQRAAALDAEARALEHARLTVARDTPRERQLTSCRHTLVAAALADDETWPALLAAAKVPDDYSDLRRALGAYPLSSQLVMRGVKRMQQREMPRLLDARAADAMATEPYDASDALPAEEGAETTTSWSRDALGIPQIPDDELARLFRRHAPQLAIETAGADDVPGHVTAARPPYLVTTRSTLYTRLAYTRFDQRVLPQLVYTWWFAARTARGRIDPLAGALDGLSWRVTLDLDGQPLAWDVVHNCGCYHMFFPSPRLRANPRSDDQAEPPWIPFTVPERWQGRMRLVLASGTHYVLALAPAGVQTSAHPYQMQPYDELRNLPSDAARVSLFDGDGLVPGSTRGERWFLWPMGVVAPGSMRQWGHHATAFVGRRHFDEAFLFERYFERAVSKSAVAGAASSAAD